MFDDIQQNDGTRFSCAEKMIIKLSARKLSLCFLLFLPIGLTAFKLAYSNDKKAKYYFESEFLA